VTERPIIRRIEYRGNKSVSESDILDAFKQKKVGLTVESQFDPTKVKRAEVVIKALLADHGHQFATVKATYERIAATNAVKLIFNIDEGPKVSVGTITIEGNHAFSSRRIIRTMRHDRPYGIPLWFADVPIAHKAFDRSKLDEDMEVGIRGLYQDNGYFKVDVSAAELKTVDVSHGAIPGHVPLVGKKHGKATDITIKIEEGEQYRMGTIKFRSADPDQGLVFKPEYLQAIFPLRQGDIFSADKIRKALDNYKKLYGEYGYIDFVATPITDLDDVKKLVNLTMELDQQKQFHVRRIEFSGNTTTRDKVIRRELLVDEGWVFNNRLWELSILRLNQLGYFETIKPEDADLKRNVKAGTVDITLKVKEKNKQSISFSGGVSGIYGTSIGLSYQTNNFLGLGETFTASVQFGNISQNITFGFTEPYLFDRPISTGFTVFFNRFDYNTARQEGILFGQQVAINPALQENYNTDSKGFTLFASYPVRKLSRAGFARFGLNYGWSTTNLKPFSQSASLLFQEIKFTSLAGPSSLNGIRESKISPSLTYDSRNNAVNPTGGKTFSIGTSFEGSLLGGNVDTISNTFSTSYFRPTYHCRGRGSCRNVLAFRLQVADITGYAGNNVPPYNRYYLGGEQDVRGYDFYTISPFVALPNLTTTTIAYQDPTTKTLQTVAVPILEFIPSRPGGDLQTVGNVEYRIPIAGPVTMSLFNDLGINGALRRSELAPDPALLASLQQQYPNPEMCHRINFFTPCPQVSDRLAILGGTNFRPHTSAGIELEVVLPVINAPFRFYYAYNYLRLNQTIVPPEGGWSFNTEPQELQKLENLGVYNTQVVPALNNFLTEFESTQKIPPNLLEPRSTFRFTVGRTF